MKEGLVTLISNHIGPIRIKLIKKTSLRWLGGKNAEILFILMAIVGEKIIITASVIGGTGRTSAGAAIGISLAQLGKSYLPFLVKSLGQ